MFQLDHKSPLWWSTVDFKQTARPVAGGDASGRHGKLAAAGLGGLCDAGLASAPGVAEAVGAGEGVAGGALVLEAAEAEWEVC